MTCKHLDDSEELRRKSQLEQKVQTIAWVNPSSFIIHLNQTKFIYKLIDQTPVVIWNDWVLICWNSKWSLDLKCDQVKSNRFIFLLILSCTIAIESALCILMTDQHNYVSRSLQSSKTQLILVITLFPYCNHASTWTNVDHSLVRFCGFNLKSCLPFCMIIDFFFKLLPHLAVGNKLKVHLQLWFWITVIRNVVLEALSKL